MQQLRTARQMMDMRQKNPGQPAESWLFCLDHAFVYELQTVGGMDLEDLTDLNKPVVNKVTGLPVMVTMLGEDGLPIYDEAGQPIEVEKTKLDMAMAYKILYHLSATWRRRNSIKMTIEEFFDELPEDFGAPIQMISSLFATAFGLGDQAKANLAKAAGNEPAPAPAPEPAPVLEPVAP